jgi:DNA-binding transcriptional ArsR family regulator
MPTRNPDRHGALAAAVDALTERVSRLERTRPASGASAVTDGSLVRRMLDELWDTADGSAPDGRIVYAGAGPWADGTVAWQIGRGWADIGEAGEDAIASLFGALANPHRIRILRELVTGPVSTSELAERLDQPSSGQLFHHLKELLAAGVIYQPERGTYAIRREDVIPVLAALSCAIDLASPHIEEESP